MVLSFPLSQASFGDTLQVVSVDWVPMWQQELSGLGSGEFLTNDLAPMLWRGDVTLRPMLHTDARALMTKFTALSSDEAFYLANPLGWWPKTDPGGTLYLTSSDPKVKSVNADKKRVAFKGLAVGLVLSAGDFWHVDYGSPSRRSLLHLVEGGTVDGAGETAELEVRPHVRPGIAADDVISFGKPAAKVKIIPGTFAPRYHSATRTQISFSVMQTLQAG
jgi:hypothetical protein